MPAFEDFLKKYKIDQDALAKVKKRVLLVGRFNQRRLGNPEVFLFTSNPERLSDTYKKNFDGVDSLFYDSFVEALQPAISEKVSDRDGKFPTIELVVPRNEDDLEGAYLIDSFNYFYTRASSTSEQPEFKERGGSTSLNELLESDTDRGKTILSRIQKNLETFCDFQTRNFEILEAASKLLGKCQGGKMPTYAEGGNLPIGFAARLMDFLYSDRADKGFEDFWQGIESDAKGTYFKDLERDKAGRRAFCQVIDAFRDSLLGKLDSGFSVSYMQTPLREIAWGAVSPELRKDFGNAREAFNGLRQILKSKVLLSMVLEWLVQSYYGLKTIDASADPAKQHEQVVDAIYDNWKQNGLKEPVRRPTVEERRRFRQLLGDSFESVIEAVVQPNTQIEAGLPQELKVLVDELRKNKSKVSTLTIVSGADKEKETHQAFIDACKMVMTDVMLAVLFRSPILSRNDLLRDLRSNLMSSYLAAVFLTDKNQDAVRRIAEATYKDFVGAIDENMRISGSKQGLVLKNLVGGFVDMLASEEMRSRLEDAIDTLTEISVVFEYLEEKESRRGASQILTRVSATQDKKRGIEETVRQSPRGENVLILQNMAKVLQAKQAASAATEPGPSAPAASAATDVAGPAATAQPGSGSGDGAKQAADRPLSKIERGVVDQILSKIEAAADSDETDEKRAEVEQAQVRAAVENNEALVVSLSRRLEAFQDILATIYQTYRRNADKREFRAVVERFSLGNMMLLFQGDLGLGKMGSNLYRMLLDLVRTVDPGKLDLGDFMDQHSLTEYFDDGDLRGQGIVRLRNQLKSQALDSLGNIVNFVSELRGITYLMDKIRSDPQAELIVLNADADEFKGWLQSENLTPGGKHRLLAGMVNTDVLRDRCIAPGLIIMLDIAFSDGKTPMDWLKSLGRPEFALRKGNFRFVLPPVCISTSAVRNRNDTSTIGTEIVESAVGSPVGVMVVGPSPRINSQSDGFATVLSAGYIVATHFLSGASQNLVNQICMEESRGRFRVLGQAVNNSIGKLFWLNRETDRYALAADEFLYVILLVAATAAGQPEEEPNFDEFYKAASLDPSLAFSKMRFKDTAKAIQSFLWSGNGEQFALAVKEEKAMSSVFAARLQGSSLLESESITELDDIKWFYVTRARAGLE